MDKATMPEPIVSEFLKMSTVFLIKKCTSFLLCCFSFDIYIITQAAVDVKSNGAKVTKKVAQFLNKFGMSLVHTVCPSADKKEHKEG